MSDELVRAGSDIDLRSGGDPVRRHRRWGVAAAVVIVAAIAAGAVVVWNTGRSSPAAGEGGPPRFVDESSIAGVEHVYAGDIQYFVGGGVAAFDCDDDGFDDLFFGGGASSAALYRNESTVGGTLRFERQPSAITDLTDVTGAYPLDIDSDGIMDLAVLRRGTGTADDAAGGAGGDSTGNVMLRGLGGCAFEDAGDSLGLDGGDDWTVGFSATWEGSNDLPTLAFGSYLVPDGDTCADSRLVRPTSAGDRYGPPVALDPGYCTLSILFSDWGRSGQRDLRMANDRHYYIDGTEQLWNVAEDAPPRLYTEADGWRPLQIWGMGIASQDVTGDGLPEVFLTSQGDNKLQTLTDGPLQPTYHDIALDSGVTTQRPYTGGDVLPSTAWHPEFEDVNNDGIVDLFITKGNVEAQVDYASRDPNNLMIGRPDGTFVEGAEAAGIVSYERARGASVVDLNLDGMLDLVVVNREATPTIWRNVGSGDADQPDAMGHWMAMRLRQPAPNVDAIGSWVEVRAGDRSSVREVTVGGGHAGGKAGWIHAGLGDAASAEVRVTWPDGETGPWIEVDADQFVTIDRGSTEAAPWMPPPR